MSKEQVVIALSLIALALQASAIATDYWSVRAQDSGINNITLNLHMGLWKFCADGGNGNSDLTGCKHLPPENDRFFPKNSLYAARVFAILGVILVFCAAGCSMYMKTSKQCQLMCLIAGGISSLIAMGIWAKEMLRLQVMGATELKFNPGYSFYLNLAGGAFALVAAAKLRASVSA